jgi:hypothetical protein
MKSPRFYSIHHFSTLPGLGFEHENTPLPAVAAGCITKPSPTVVTICKQQCDEP